MNKRKIDINDLKKKSQRGKKYRTISVKYTTMLAFFKQKSVVEKDVFEVGFFPLINDLLQQLNAFEILQKISTGSQ